METILCFDIGGTKTKYACIKENTILFQAQQNTYRGSKEGFFKFLSEIIDAVSKEYSFDKISLSFPGFIDVTTGIAIFAGALSELHGTNIKIELTKFLIKDYQIYIENDANCAAMAEKLNGHATKNEDFVVVTVGTGIGGGIFVNGEILRGKQFRAGEFGMMLLAFSEYPNKVYSEFASTQSLIRLYRELKHIPLTKEISGQDIFAEDDQDVQQVITSWVAYLACGIVNVVSVLNPEKVLIGGGISANPALLPLLKEQLQHIHFWKDLAVPVETCFHYNNAGLLGAYYLAKAM